MGDRAGPKRAYDEPYHLCNRAADEINLDTPAGLHGSVPFIMGINKNNSATGTFLVNPTETFIDVIGKVSKHLSRPKDGPLSRLSYHPSLPFS